MIGNNKEVGRLANSFRFEGAQNLGQILIHVPNCSETLPGTGTGPMLGRIGFVHPEEGKLWNPISPNTEQGLGRPVVTSAICRIFFWKLAMSIYERGRQLGRKRRT